MSQNFLIGDTHYGHNGISRKFRTVFSSDEEHDNTIHQNIMDCSGKRNNIFLLGDILFKVGEFWRLDQYAKYYDKVFLCLGNHDHQSLAKYAAQFDNVYVFGIIKKWGFWLSHCPIHPQELYRGWNIHGHVHNNTVPDARYFNACCENLNYKPIDLQRVRAEFEARKSLLVSFEKHRD